MEMRESEEQIVGRLDCRDAVEFGLERLGAGGVDHSQVHPGGIEIAHHFFDG